MDTWLNRDQSQHSLEKTDRQRSRRRQLPRSLFSSEIASDSDRYCVSNRNTKRNREGEEGLVGQARQFVVRRPVLQRRRLLRQLLYWAVLPVCRCLPLSGVVCCRFGLGWCRCWWDDAASAAVAAGRLHCGATAWPKLARLHTNRALKPQRADKNKWCSEKYQQS